MLATAATVYSTQRSILGLNLADSKKGLGVVMPSKHCKMRYEQYSFDWDPEDDEPSSLDSMTPNPTLRKAEATLPPTNPIMKVQSLTHYVIH